MLLNSSTVQSNGAGNVVNGSNVLDLIFARANGNVQKTRDRLSGVLPGDDVVGI